MTGPLDGIHVLEIGHYIAGPHAAQMLGDQGAEVIKVEPLGGDPSRLNTRAGQVGDSMFYACHNRGKRSIALDLSDARAALALDPLLRWADIVVTNYTAGVPERLGFGYPHLEAINPRAVMVHVTGYNVAGPWRDYAAFDGTIIAMSGLAEMTGHEDGPPVLSQILFADHSVGAHAAFAAATALAERERTGRGRLIEMNMLDVMTTYLGHQIAMMGLWNLDPTRSRIRSGTRFVHRFATQTGTLFVAAITPGMWRSYSQLVGHPEWAPRGMTEVPDLYADGALRDAAVEAGERFMASMTAHDAMAALQAKGITCGIMRSARAVFDEEVAKGSGAVHHVRYPDGTRVPVPGPAISAGHPPSPSVSSLGSDGEAILETVGLDPELIRSLHAAGVFRRNEIDPALTGIAEPVPPHLSHWVPA